MKYLKSRWTVWIMAGGVSFGIWLFFRPIMIAVGLWQEMTVGSVREEFRQCLGQAIQGLDLLWVNVPVALGIFISGGLFGYWLLQRFFPLDEFQDGCDPDERTSKNVTYQRVVFGLGLGVFAISLGVLFLGLTGILYRWVFFLLLIGLAIPQAVKWIGYLITAHPQKRNPRPPETGRWLKIILIPIATLTLMAILVPAGILWRHDGNGFDVLEYHLQLPHEYVQVGQVRRIEHNVYSNFPANTEMLYLLAIVLKNNAVEGMYLAQLINFMLAGCLIISVYTFCGSARRATLATAVITGPQLIFVAANAYVECYMLWMFFLAGAAALHLRKKNSRQNNGIKDWKWWILAGLFTGAACGCKYTAVVLVIPVVLWWVAWSAKHKIKAMLITALAACTAFSPWLIKNMYYCGNPVFPQAVNLFGKSDWSDMQVQHWQRAHQPPENLSALPVRSTELGSEIVKPFHYGGLFLLLVFVILSAGRNGQLGNGVLFGLAIAAQVAVWFFWTHLQSRFLLPIIVPAAFWIAEMAEPVQKWKKNIISFVLVIVVMIHTGLCAWAYNDSTRGFNSKYGFLPVVRRDDVARCFLPFSDPDKPVPPGTKCWLIGESRPFYLLCDYIYNTAFDRNELVEMIQDERSEKELLALLHQRRVTHVFVNWDEMARLNNTYGYANGVNHNTFLQSTGRCLIPVEDPSVSLSRSIQEEFAVPAGEGPLFEMFEVRQK